MDSLFRVVISYDGTNYRGWQEQEPKQEAEMPSIARTLQTAIQKATDTSLFQIHGSGRTDVGVHARAQTAHLRVSTRLEASTLQRAINSYLPSDIRVLSVEKMSYPFHAQTDAINKCYRYFILHKIRHEAPNSVFLGRWCWYIPQALDYEEMRRGLDSLVGVHDFVAFRNVGTEVSHTVREIFEAKLLVHEFSGNSVTANFPWLPGPNSGVNLLEIQIRGNGFLKQMVRNIVGTIVEVGKRKLSAPEVQKIIESKDRSQCGPTAPARGLFLNDVQY